jgi:rhodanese-related sulfurtransferase
MNAKELKQKIQSNEPLVIIDIREPYECENGYISEINIPLSEFMTESMKSQLISQ